MKNYVNAATCVLSACLFLSIAQAADTADGSNLTFRLAKDSDSKDTNNPATFSYQRSDGGKSDYVTEGAIKTEADFLKYNELLVTPDISWNRNTLASSPTDNWNAGVDFLYKYLYGDTLDRFEFDLGVKRQQDLIKSADSLPVKLDITLYSHFLQSELGDWNPNYNWTLRPTLSVFRSDVYSAAINKTTGIAPTGVLSGEILTLDLERRWRRWSASASAKNEYVANDVAGQVGGLHRLSTLALSYDFFDQPLEGIPKGSKQSPSWKTGIALKRQVGDDPLNAVAPTGYTQVLLTVKY